MRYGGLSSAKVIRRQKNDGKSDPSCVCFELLDYCTPFIGLFLEDDRLKVQLLEKASKPLLCCLIMAMNDENFV